MIQIPAKAELLRLYNDEMMSINEIATKYNVSFVTAKTWISGYHIPQRTRVDNIRIANQKKSQRAKDKWIQLNAEAELQATSIIKEEEKEPNSVANVMPASIDDEDNDDPWSRLTRSQKEAVVMMADIANRRTQQQIAEKVGVTPTTLSAWKRNPDFSYCLIAMVKAEFQREMTLLWSVDMYERWIGGKPMTADDRKLVADVLGLSNDSTQVNVNVNVTDSFRRF